MEECGAGGHAGEESGLGGEGGAEFAAQECAHEAGDGELDGERGSTGEEGDEAVESAGWGGCLWAGVWGRGHGVVDAGGMLPERGWRRRDWSRVCW